MSEDRNEIFKEIAKEAYSDMGHPVVAPVGELVGLIPRAIKAALAPVEKWILQREYNISETKKILEEKLKDIPPELIHEPEPHIAVPTIQYLSYCMDNEELRDMYANLLAHSMVDVVKNGVHPGFVEIIKQLCPDEAKILRYMFIKSNYLPTVKLRYEDAENQGIDIIKNFSNVGELSGCESDKPQDISKYFDNLLRLRLIESAGELASLTNKELYEPLKNHRYILPLSTDDVAIKNHFEKARIREGFINLSSFGDSFCSICLSSIDDTINIKI